MQSNNTTLLLNNKRVWSHKYHKYLLIQQLFQKEEIVVELFMRIIRIVSNNLAQIKSQTIKMVKTYQYIHRVIRIKRNII